MTRDDELTRLRATVEQLRAENEALVARAADVERHAAERERAEQRARTILESVRDAFFSLDREFRFTYLNPQAERFLRRSSAELIGQDLFVAFPAAVGTVFDREYHRAMRDRVPVQFVEHYPAPLDRWYEVRADPAPEGLSVYFQDITERLAAEEEHRRAVDAIRRGREQMELVVRSADVGVWFCPLPFDVLVWDTKVKEHFHLPPEAVVTIDTFYERIHPDDRERTRRTIDASISARGTYDIDYRTVSPDGRSTKWIRALGRTFSDERGEPIQFDGITIDVSARKRAELALQESEERYRLATRATDDAIWDWDVEADTIRWNEALATHFLHRVEASSSAWWLDRVHPDDRDAVAASLAAVKDDPSREHWQGEYRFRRGDGSWAEVLDRGYVVRETGGRAVRMLGSMTDRTHERVIERQRERMVEAERAARGEAERQVRMKDEFLATVSHELRTPSTRSSAGPPSPAGTRPFRPTWRGPSRSSSATRAPRRASSTTCST